MSSLNLHPRPSPQTSVGTQKAAWLLRMQDIEHVQSLIASGSLAVEPDQAAAVDRALAEARAALSRFAAARRRRGPRI